MWYFYRRTGRSLLLGRDALPDGTPHLTKHPITRRTHLGLRVVVRVVPTLDGEVTRDAILS